jgi:TolB-like protein
VSAWLRARRAHVLLWLASALSGTLSERAQAAPVGPGVVVLSVFGLEADPANEVAAQTLTNELRQVIVESEAHALSLANPALLVAAQAAGCSLGSFTARLGPDSDQSIDTKCQRSMAVRLGARYLVWGHAYEEAGRLQVKLHVYREGQNGHVVTLPYETASPKRLARRLYLKLMVPEGSGDVRLTGDAAFEGAELWVDGKAEGAYAPGLALTLPIGEHAFELRREGRIVARARANVLAREAKEVRLDFVPRTDLDPTEGFRDPPPVTVTPGGGWKRTAGFVGLGVAAVSLGVGVISSVRVGALNDQFTSEGPYAAYFSSFAGSSSACDAADRGQPAGATTAASPGQVSDACSQLATFRALQYVSYGLAALSAGAGAYLLWSAPKPSSPLRGSPSPGLELRGVGATAPGGAASLGVGMWGVF